MKISEIRSVVNEDIADTLKSGLYKASGGSLFGQTGQQAALKNNFIKKFSNQLALNIKSAKRSGMGGFDLDDYLKSYAAQYGWNLTPKEIENLTTLSTKAGPNPNGASLQRVANYVYMLADKYRESRKAGPAEPSAPSTPKKPAGPTTPKEPDAPAGPTDPAAPTQPAAPNPTPSTPPPEDNSTSAEKIMAALSQLYKMPSAATDLDKILRDVAYLLSRKDAARYKHVMKDLTAGAGGAGAAGTKASPYPGDQPSKPQQNKTSAAPNAGTQSSTPKGAEQAMPGYNKAADDLSRKMKSNLPKDTTITKPYRPGSRPQSVTDVEPKLKEFKKFKRK